MREFSAYTIHEKHSKPAPHGQCCIRSAWLPTIFNNPLIKPDMQPGAFLIYQGQNPEFFPLQKM
jgi:hypothetical protein